MFVCSCVFQRSDRILQRFCTKYLIQDRIDFTFGIVWALVRLVDSIVKKKGFHVAMDLGKALSLALEFKMGAEIIKTVIIHNLEELAILGIVVIIRALLSVVIHWEMRLEEKENAKHERENIK